MDNEKLVSSDEPCIDADQMAGLLERSPSLIRRMARKNQIPAHVIKNGCRIYYSFRPSEVLAALRNDYGKEENTGSGSEDRRAEV